MTDKYCQTLYTRLRAQIEESCRPLLSNNIKDMEHYKLVSGQKMGLELAVNLAQELYKEMYEKDILSYFESGEENERNRKSDETRRLY